MKENNQIVEEFCEIVMQVLGVEREEVVPTARFFRDLGGESIEILDLSFRCQKHFGLKTEFQKMLPLEQIVIDDQRRLTPESIQIIKTRVPFVEVKTLESGLTIDHIQDLVTVGALTEYLLLRLAQAERERTAVANAASVG